MEWIAARPSECNGLETSVVASGLVVKKSKTASKWILIQCLWHSSMAFSTAAFSEDGSLLVKLAQVPEVIDAIAHIGRRDVIGGRGESRGGGET